MRRTTSTAMTMPAIAPPLRPVAADTTGASVGLVVGLASFSLVGLLVGFKVSPLLVGAVVLGLAVGTDVGWAVGDSVGALLDGPLVGIDEGLNREMLLGMKFSQNGLLEYPSKR